MLKTTKTGFIEFNERNCRACWECVKSCPKDVFKKLNILIHKHAVIASAQDCTGCKKCVKACRFEAIRALQI